MNVMSRIRRGVVRAVVPALLFTAACGSGGGDPSPSAAPSPPHFLAPGQTVRIGVPTDLPGMGFQEEDGSNERRGFNIDLMNWLASDLNIQPSPVDTRFDQRIPFMRNRTTQVMLSNFAINDDRRKDVDFVGPYMLTRQTLMVRQDEENIRDYTSIKGREVCVPRDTTSQDVVDEILKPNGAIPLPLKSIKQCVAELEAGRADAVLTIDIDLLGFAAHPDHKKRVQVLDLPQIGPEDRFGIGLPNGDRRACEFLTHKLRAYLTSGAWDAHFKKNFPGERIERFKPDPNTLDPCE